MGNVKEEEEPAGEEAVGPSGEAIASNSGDTLFLPLLFFFKM